DAPVLLAVGSLSPEKRLDRLLRLAAVLRAGHPQLYVWIVGDGPLLEPLQRLAAELQVQDRVQFWGTQANIGDFLCAADLLALTSDTEGMPGVLLEAGYTATPVVATRVGGVAECVRNGETGILVDPADEGALAQAAAGLLADGERRRQMGEAARRWVAAHFTIERVAGQYLSFYESLMAL
ncbi:MAG TPA: glycosyltransferase, partial [Caldilineaceae bacterium]|nr:glycosyltransferase [Caldilineaceae bacterium]